MLRYNNMRHRELPLSTDSSNLFLKVMISIAVFLFAVTLAGVLDADITGWPACFPSIRCWLTGIPAFSVR